MTEEPRDGCEAEALFGEIWGTLTDLLGSAATATLVRRSVKRAAQRVPGLDGLSVLRDQFEYRYVLPPAWHHGGSDALAELRELAHELGPLLFELTGPVVLRRLQAHPGLVHCNIFSAERAP